MKRMWMFLIVFSLLFSSVPYQTAYAGEEYQENVIDKISDWAATVGKDKNERDRILAQRKAERMKVHAQKKAEKAKNEAKKKGEEMKKKMGM